MQIVLDFLYFVNHNKYIDNEITKGMTMATNAENMTHGLTDGEIKACSIDPVILRMLAATHKEISEQAETMGDEVCAAYHATRASELNSKADKADAEDR
jgi:hypothetical protein